jgi:hypothetical protein
VPPARQESGGNEESKAIETRQPWTPHSSMEDDDLVAEHGVLKEQIVAVRIVSTSAAVSSEDGRALSKSPEVTLRTRARVSDRQRKTFVISNSSRPREPVRPPGFARISEVASTMGTESANVLGLPLVVTRA